MSQVTISEFWRFLHSLPMPPERLVQHRERGYMSFRLPGELAAAGEVFSDDSGKTYYIRKELLCE